MMLIRCTCLSQYNVVLMVSAFREAKEYQDSLVTQVCLGCLAQKDPSVSLVCLDATEPR